MTLKLSSNKKAPQRVGQFKYQLEILYMQWIKHDTDANQDAKLQNVLLDYGLEGYGLYWYCIELIAGKVDKNNITFELEHDARILARNTGSTLQKVTEMMKYFVEIGLFECSNNTITCLKLAKRLDQSMTSNPQMREIISNFKNHDKVMISSDEVMQDKIRLDKNKKENNKTDFSPLALSDEELKELKALRSKKKASLTQRVVNTLAKEFELSRKRGYTNDDILNEWSNRGWTSYKDEWMNIKPSNKAQQQQAPQSEYDALQEMNLL